MSVEPVVTSWAMGTRRLYDLVDDDPRFAFHPVEHVCDPAVIAGNEQMVSVTQAFAVDLTGQVCTESLDGELYGGISTGPAFHRGALASPGGMAIVCLASRTPAGRSAICLDLGPGEAVAIPRADVHWVITEYGTAYLFGRSLAERAVALIEIDYEQEMAFAVAVGPAEWERIVAASSYYLSPATGLAEVAYMVDPEWQGAGLGGLLHARMFEYARARGVRGFRADVLVGNTRMMRVFQPAGHQLNIKTSAGIEEVTMLFPEHMPDRLPAVGGPAVGWLAACNGTQREETQSGCG